MEKRWGLGSSLLTIALFLAGCGNASNTASNTQNLSTPERANTGPMNSNARSNSNAPSTGDSFWTEAALGGMAEVELGNLAKTKAQNAEVKKFAEMMVADHSKANEELKGLAAKKSVALPTALDSKHQSTIQRLQGLSGADFDRAYVDDMVTDHETDVEEFEKQSKNNPDPDLKAFATKTLPTLRKHLDAIKAVKGKLK